MFRVDIPVFFMDVSPSLKIMGWSCNGLYQDKSISRIYHKKKALPVSIFKKNPTRFRLL